LYRSAPTLATRSRYIESQDACRACIEFVASHGGARWFDRTRWRGELLGVEASARRRAGTPLYESPLERAAALRREFFESKSEIEARLPGHVVRHFCYPWGYGLSNLSDLAREAGYVTIFWLDPPGLWRRLSRVGDDLLRIPRLGETWLLSLPGHHRRSLADQLLVKTKRRILHGSGYLTHT
jgi:peptidoglycan/xylan/chitin deacetylase (PgdA/CDA1 family)